MNLTNVIAINLTLCQQSIRYVNDSLKVLWIQPFSQKIEKLISIDLIGENGFVFIYLKRKVNLSCLRKFEFDFIPRSQIRVKELEITLIVFQINGVCVMDRFRVVFKMTEHYDKWP